MPDFPSASPTKGDASTVHPGIATTELPVNGAGQLRVALRGVLAKTLTAQVGEGSELFRRLDPEHEAEVVHMLETRPQTAI